MKVYLYAKSGHALGLDATRRCAAITKLLQEKDCDPILCTCDFRAGAYAKSVLGIKKYVSVDVLSNLPNIMQRGDILIFDSDEASDFTQGHMKGFCTLLYKIPEDIPSTIIDKTLYTKQKEAKKDKVFFYGDDDYKENLLNICKGSSKKEISLLLGHYFFLGNEKKLEHFFDELIDEEEYVEVIKQTKFLLSGSLNACLESIACGNKPVLLKRVDKDYDEELIKKLHLPTISSDNLDDIINKFEKIINNYPKLNKVEEFDLNPIIHDIFVRIDTFRKLTNQ